MELHVERLTGLNPIDTVCCLSAKDLRVTQMPIESRGTWSQV